MGHEQLRHGLDLGQAQDYTALSVVERAEPANGSRDPLLHVRHLERFPLRTPYPDIAARVANMLHNPPLERRCTLVADATGCGVPVVDLLCQHRAYPVAVTITGGDVATKDERGGSKVPKRDLVSTLQVLLQSKRLECAALPETGILQREMLNLKVKISLTTAHDSYGAWREGEHDDLVLSVALACWYAVRFPADLDGIATGPRKPDTWCGEWGRMEL